MDKILATAKPPKESLAAINNFGIGEFHSKENVSFYKESQGCLLMSVRSWSFSLDGS